MWDEISQMTNICHPCTQNGTFKFYQKRNCPLSNARCPPGRGNGQRGPFFRPSKTTFKRVLRNQIPIENDRENDEYDDENGDNFDV